MTKDRTKYSRPQNPNRALILCEGQCELWYFSKVLSTKVAKIEKAGDSKSNAKSLVNSLIKKQKYEDIEYSKIFCVFDRDNKSNSREQLESANKIIARNRFERVFSNPCFEVFFLFSRSSNTSIHSSKEINTKLNNEFDMDYNKKEHDFINIMLKTDFKVICENAKIVYDKLNVDNNNWLNLEDGFSEIFKLEEYAI